LSRSHPEIGRRGLGVRWLKFSAVGVAGVGIQLAALVILKSALSLHYLVATALAVEVAVLHNFVWHERWTWRERTRSSLERRLVFGRLFRFHVSNGLVSILSNLMLMRLFVGYLGFHYLPANILSIAITALANFLLSEFFVFRREKA
jgi:dolichol-phosphate mannosyltransferase